MNQIAFNAIHPAFAAEKFKSLAAQQLWNRLVTKKAVQIEEQHDCFMVRHATKGWRRISKKRLGLA